MSIVKLQLELRNLKYSEMMEVAEAAAALSRLAAALDATEARVERLRKVIAAVNLGDHRLWVNALAELQEGDR